MTPTPGRPAVSVIVPAYNRAAVIGRALGSIFAQTFQDLEVIVVDDCSTDDVRSVLSRQQDPRLKTIGLSRRSGAAHARNAGIAESRGEWIAFLDSDDEWLPTFLEQYIESVKRLAFDAAYGPCERRRGNEPGEVRPKGALSEGEVLTAFFQRRHPIAPSSVMVRRTALKRVAGFDESFPSAEDIDLWLRLAAAGCRFAAVRDALVIKHDSGAGQMKQDAVGKAIGFRKMDARWGPVMRSRIGEQAYQRWYRRRARSIAAKQETELNRLSNSKSRLGALRYARSMAALLPWSRAYVMRGLGVAVAGRTLRRLAPSPSAAVLPND